jgi:hypothetical protein
LTAQDAGRKRASGFELRDEEFPPLWYTVNVACFSYVLNVGDLFFNIYWFGISFN